MFLSPAKPSDAAAASAVTELTHTLVSDCKKPKSLSPSRRRCWSQRESDDTVIVFALFTVLGFQSFFWMFSEGKGCLCVNSSVVKRSGSQGWSFHKDFFLK